MRRCSSLCDLYNHCPLACLLPSTGKELPSVPRLVKPMLDPLPLAHVCLHLFVSSMPCLDDLSHHTCCIVLSPSSCSPLQSIQGSHTQNSLLSSFLGPLLKSRFTASATEPLCPVCLCAVLSWKFCSLFFNAVKFVAGLKLSCTANLSYLIGRSLRIKALERVFETAFPASCSLVSNSCPRMKKLSRSSESSSCSRASCATKVTTVGVSTLYCKSFQAFAPSLMPSSPTQSCLISMRVVAS